MFLFFIGIVVGGVSIMMLPPEKEDWLRQWIIKQWQKVTKKG